MSFRIPFGSWIMNQAVANMLKPAWQSSSSHVWGGAGATRGHLITSKRVLGCHDKPWSKAADIWSHAFLGPTPEKLRMIQDWAKAILGLGINTLIISQQMYLQFMQSLFTSNASTDQAVSCTHVIQILWLHLGSWSDAFYSWAWRSMRHAYLRHSVVCQRLTRKGLLQRLSTFLLCPSLYPPSDLPSS